jgi:hypothetical protein
VSLSEVTPCPCGIHPGLANSSARCPTSARSSSRKRAQSARRSSETNSPGSSDWQGGFLGCSLGPDVTPHPRVEDVDNSDLVNRRRLGAWGFKRRRRPQLYAFAGGLIPPERVRTPTKSAQRA